MSASPTDRHIVVDASAGLVPGGGIGRYVRDLTYALRMLPDAPPARFLATANMRELARERFSPEQTLLLPFPWRQFALRIMAGVDKDFNGEARAAPGIKIGYLEQEPKLDPEKTVREEVEQARGEWKRAKAAGCEVTYWQQGEGGRWEKRG